MFRPIIHFLCCFNIDWFVCKMKNKKVLCVALHAHIQKLVHRLFSRYFFYYVKADIITGAYAELAFVCLGFFQKFTSEKESLNNTAYCSLNY